LFEKSATHSAAVIFIRRFVAKKIQCYMGASQPDEEDMDYAFDVHKQHMIISYFLDV
jgi:hypothetical protein